MCPAANLAPLRVLFLSRPFVHIGGVRTSLENLIRHSDARQIVFIHVGIGKRHPQSPRFARIYDYLISAWNVYRALRKEHPDLIVLNPSLNPRSIPLHFALLIGIRIVSRFPTLLYFRGWAERVGAHIQHRSMLGRLLAGIINQSSHIIVLASRFKEQLTGGGIDPQKITVLPEMVDTTVFKPGTQPEHDREVHLRLFFISRLVRAKGAHLLVDTAHHLRLKAPDLVFKLVIAGDGPERIHLATRIDQLGLAENVSLPGPVFGEEKLRYFQQTDLFLFPSRHDEGFPISVLEAMACGLPLIYTPKGALGEILGPDNGIRIETDELDYQRLTEAVLTLAHDSKRREAAGRCNLAQAREMYDLKIVIPQIVALFEKVAGRGTDA